MPRCLTDRRQLYAEPVRDRRVPEGGPAELSKHPSAQYRWNSALAHTPLPDCGRIDTRNVYRCPECGSPADSPTQDCCRHCGSCSPPTPPIRRNR